MGPWMQGAFLGAATEDMTGKGLVLLKLVAYYWFSMKTFR